MSQSAVKDSAYRAHGIRKCGVQTEGFQNYSVKIGKSGSELIPSSVLRAELDQFSAEFCLDVAVPTKFDQRPLFNVEISSKGSCTGGLL